MKKIGFTGHFNVIDFSFSHKILLIRNTEIVNEGPFNTDLLFQSTYYLEIPTRFNGITIERGTLQDCDYLKSKCTSDSIINIDPARIYILHSEEKKYYIGAWKLQIITNTYDAGETSIGLKRI
ncbi:hypothetical protein [Hymenobacter crusticola]|uniref:hypothetical protein n=1 Tax=Hymenobacter crusticola TaxID=1770526 RepID=UPI000A3ADCC8|nr:hypothetical protein [Hymenobacter crusticola]